MCFVQCQKVNWPYSQLVESLWVIVNGVVPVVGSWGYVISESDSTASYWSCWFGDTTIRTNPRVIWQQIATEPAVSNVWSTHPSTAGCCTAGASTTPEGTPVSVPDDGGRILSYATPIGLWKIADLPSTQSRPYASLLPSGDQKLQLHP